MTSVTRQDPQAWSRVKHKTDLGEAVTYAFVGDSLVVESGSSSGLIESPWPQTLTELVKDYYNNPNISILQHAGNGWTSNDILQTYATSVIGNNPDVIFLANGMNNARNGDSIDVNTLLDEYVADNRQMIEAAIANNIPVVVIGVTLRSVEHLTDRSERWVRFMRETMQALATEYGLPYFNSVEYMYKLIRTDAIGWNEVSFDGTHRSQFGSDLFTGQVFSELFAFEDIKIDKVNKTIPLAGQALDVDFEENAEMIRNRGELRNIRVESGKSVKLYFYNNGPSGNLFIRGQIKPENGSAAQLRNIFSRKETVQTVKFEDIRIETTETFCDLRTSFPVVVGLNVIEVVAVGNIFISAVGVF